MNVWRKIGLGALMLIIILSGMVVFLVSTDKGLHLLLRISSHWITGLEIGQISGNWHNLYLKNITYIQSGLTIETGEFRLILDVHCLRKGKLFINNISLKDIDVVIDPGRFSGLTLKKGNRKIDYSINLLKSYPIIVDHMILNNVNVRINDTVISVRNFTSGLRWREKNIIFNSTLLQGLLINLPKIVKFPKGNIIEYALHKFRLKEKSLNRIFRIFFSRLVLSKTTGMHFPFNFKIEEFRGEYLRLVHPSINIDFVINSMLMKFSNVNGDMYLSKMNIDSNRGTLSIIASMKSFGSWPINIVLNSFLDVKPLQSEKISLKIKGILTKKIKASLSLSGPLEANLCEEIYILKTGENSSLNLINTMIPKIGKNRKNLVQKYRVIEIPKFMIDLTINKFYWKRLSVDKIHINGYMKYIGQLYGKLNVHMENFVKPNINIRLATLEITGNEKHHNLKLLMHGQSISGNLYLTGRFDREKKCWRGQLNNILFKTSIGLWDLISSLPKNFPEKEINIESLCENTARTSKIAFCIPRDINLGSEGHSAISIKCSGLEVLKPLVPDTLYISGMLSGKVNVTWNSKKGDILQSDVFLSGRKIKISNTICGISCPIAISLIHLKIGMNNDHVKFNWMMHLDDLKSHHSPFYGEIQVSNWHKNHNLNGIINISSFRLAFMNNFNLQKKWQMEGIFNAHLRFFGNIEHPQIFGNININNININSSFFPFNIQSSEVTINFSGMHSTLQVKAQMQRGLINLNGDIDWKQIRNWRIHASIQGSKIHITMPLVINFDVLSDITFEITPMSFTFKGYVNIPWARIIINELPEKIEVVSNEEQLSLDEDMKPIELKSTGIPISGDLIVHIGSNVRIDALGIKSNLIGDIKVNQRKQRLNLNGQISMSKGRFYSYGQDFLIRKGDLFFSGASIKPFVNIEAIRNPETTEKNIIIGIRITGMIDELKTEIFSEPIISRHEILSYLLRGHGINQQDHTSLISMIINLWTTQINQLVNSIGEILGAKNLVLDTRGIGDSSQLVVSGYVLPNLQMKYGVGIFDSLETFTLHYHLMPKLYLEIISGKHQSIDLIYRFKF